MHSFFSMKASNMKASVKLLYNEVFILFTLAFHSNLSNIMHNYNLTII